MAQKKRINTWYLCPRDAHTNETFGKTFSEENFMENAMCADGRMRNLWRCTEQERDDMISSRKKGMEISFDIFNSQGEGTTIRRMRDVSFLFKRKRRRLPLVRASELPKATR